MLPRTRTGLRHESEEVAFRRVNDRLFSADPLTKPRQSANRPGCVAHQLPPVF